MVSKSRIIKLVKKKRHLKLKHSIICKITSIFGEKRLLQKMQRIDQESLNLIKTDEEEMNILREYHKIEFLKKDDESKIQSQRQLVKQMIKAKNKQHKAQKKLVKELTKRNKKMAKVSAEKEVEELLNVEEELKGISLD